MDKMKYILTAAFLVCNFIVLVLYGIDKGLSKTKRRRISEKALIWASFLGGFGAFLGMVLFRHKTRKAKFFLTVPLFFLLSVAELVIILKI